MASERDRDPHHEGPEAARRFESTLKRIVSVPKAELVKREAAYKKSRRAKKASAVRAR
jgi:hypothetical protein